MLDDIQSSKHFPFLSSNSIRGTALLRGGERQVKMKDRPDLLREAADDLEYLDLPANAKFDMAVYGEHSPSEHSPEEKNYCGTTACALGWLTTMKKWNERGAQAYWVQDAFRGWYLEPDRGRWRDLSNNMFGVSLGDKVHDEVFQMMSFSREEAIKRMRGIANAWENMPVDGE